MTKPPPAGRSKSLPIFGIRALAALSLLTVHVAVFAGLFGTTTFGEHEPAGNPITVFFVSGLPVTIGVLFVPPAIFFYLPIAKAIIAGAPRPNQRNTLIRRLLRLLPAYYLMYLVVLVTLNRSELHDAWAVLRPIFLLQVYLPHPFAPSSMNGMEITWSVPDMIQWYFAMALIAWATHKFAARGLTPAIRARRLMLPVPILFVVGFGWLVLVKALGGDDRTVFWWPFGIAPAIGVGMALAIMLALCQVSPKDTPRLIRLAAARPQLFWGGALLVFLINCTRPFSVIGTGFTPGVHLLVTSIQLFLFGSLVALPLIAPKARRIALVDVTLTNRPMIFLGRISYGIYLWHFAIMHFYLQPGSILRGDTKSIDLFYGKTGFVKLELVTVVGTVIAASLSYYLVERPISAWTDRHFRDNVAKVVGPVPRRPALPAAAEPLGGVMTLDEAMAAVAAAEGDRDAIRSNLGDLEGSFGSRLLADADLSGQSSTRWQAATADMAAMWEIFGLYSAVVDDAATALSRSRPTAATELVAVTGLLNGASIMLTDPPPPLARRNITDDGRTNLTVAAALERMNRLFRKTAELVTAVEAVWNEATAQVGSIRVNLAQVQEAGAAASVATAEAELQRLLEALRTDPLAMWQEDRVDTSELDRLKQRVSTIAPQAQTGEVPQRPAEQGADG